MNGTVTIRMCENGAQHYKAALAAIPAVTEEEAKAAAARLKRALLEGQESAAREALRGGSRTGKTARPPEPKPGENRAQRRAREKRERRQHPGRITGKQVAKLWRR